MSKKTDIYNIAVKVFIINFMLSIIFFSVNLSANPDENEYNQFLLFLEEETNNTGDFMPDSGICPPYYNESLCISQGCEWDSVDGVCDGNIVSGDHDSSIQDPYVKNFKLGKMLGLAGEVILGVVILPIFIIMKVYPIIDNLTLKYLITLFLIAYQLYIIKYAYAFVTNFRGIQKE